MIALPRERDGQVEKWYVTQRPKMCTARQSGGILLGRQYGLGHGVKAMEQKMELSQIG